MEERATNRPEQGKITLDWRPIPSRLDPRAPTLALYEFSLHRLSNRPLRARIPFLLAGRPANCRSSKTALDPACCLASELSIPQVQPGRSRQIIASLWRVYASDAGISEDPPTGRIIFNKLTHW